MAKGKVIHPVEHDGVRYEAGSTIEADNEVIDQLIAAGAVKDPSVKEEDDSTDVVADAKAKAKAIVDAAEKTLADAKTAAEKIREDAGKQAESVVTDAKTEAADIAAKAKDAGEKIVADAKVKADKIVKDAQDAAAKLAESRTPVPTK